MPVKQIVAVLLTQQPVYIKRAVNGEKCICRISWFYVNNNATRKRVVQISHFSCEIGSPSLCRMILYLRFVRISDQMQRRSKQKQRGTHHGTNRRHFTVLVISISSPKQRLRVVLQYVLACHLHSPK
jgi:hypothetical protein